MCIEFPSKTLILILLFHGFPGKQVNHRHFGRRENLQEDSADVNIYESHLKNKGVHRSSVNYGFD